MGKVLSENGTKNTIRDVALPGEYAEMTCPKHLATPPGMNGTPLAGFAVPINMPPTPGSVVTVASRDFSDDVAQTKDTSTTATQGVIDNIHVTFNITCPSGPKKSTDSEIQMIKGAEDSAKGSLASRVAYEKKEGFVLGSDAADDVFKVGRPRSKSASQAPVFSLSSLKASMVVPLAPFFKIESILEKETEDGVPEATCKIVRRIDNTPDSTPFSVRKDRRGETPSRKNAQGHFLPECAVFVGDLLKKGSQEALEIQIKQKFSEYGLCFVTAFINGGLPHAIVQYTNTANANKALTDGLGAKILGRPVRVEKADASRVLVVRRRDGTKTTEGAINSVASIFGTLEKIWEPTDTEVERMGLPRWSFFVRYAYYLDFKDAQKAFRRSFSKYIGEQPCTVAMKHATTSGGGSQLPSNINAVGSGGGSQFPGNVAANGDFGGHGFGPGQSYPGIGVNGGPGHAHFPYVPATDYAPLFPGMDGQSLYLSNRPALPPVTLHNWFSQFGTVVTIVSNGVSAIVVFVHAADCYEAVRQLGPRTVIGGTITKVQVKGMHAGGPILRRHSGAQPTRWMESHNAGASWNDMSNAWFFHHARIDIHGWVYPHLPAGTFGDYFTQDLGITNHYLFRNHAGHTRLAYNGTEADAAACGDGLLYVHGVGGLLHPPFSYTQEQWLAYMRTQSTLIYG